MWSESKGIIAIDYDDMPGMIQNCKILDDDI